ncbi:MAG: DUF4445 domain-containing protein [Lentisphaeria bacterium]|nr:DUF4445 domain-containing protein [Lentisphaeria bacterium]
MLTTLVFENKAIHVYPQETLLDALRRNGFDIAAGCGGKNRCGSCRIRLLSGNFICNGKMLSVSEDSPVEMNSCALKMLSNGKAEYPQKKTTEYFSEIRQDFSIEIPADFPVSLVFDLGTTNIEAALIENGRISHSTLLNQQTLFGDNVIERIAFAADSAHRETLRRALITETCLPLIKKLTNHPDKIQQVFVSGNTAMTHFFFNEDPSLLGQAPFQPEKLSFKGTAQSTGLDILLPETPVTAIPCLGGFIGGDITAGLLQCGISSRNNCHLFMDIGTNCEMFLNVNGKYYALSAAAGPAFERGHSRADDSAAVRHISFEQNQWKMIPELERFSGFCGTALVDLLAEGRRNGFLDPFAKWQKTPDLPEVLYCSNAVLSEIVSAKAAIQSGLKVLFKYAGISKKDIDTVYLAGNFSTHLNIPNAVSVGLLPDLPEEKFIRAGNAALAGTITCALAPERLSEIEMIQKKTTLINPAEDPDYMRLFTLSMNI